MRVVLADPPAFTPAYDHELAAALARAGAEVELVTSRFRFGESPAPDGYARRELFYPLSSRLFRRSRLRLPLKVAEHPLGLAALRRRARTCCTCSGSSPELDVRLFRPHAPSVFTAHDLLPRRTARKQRRSGGALLQRFDRVVVHSERGRETLAGLGVDAHRVIPHPVFPSDPARRDDGRTVLCFGVIRPYKGLGDAIEAVRRAGDARLLVAGDPLEPIEPYREAARGLDVEWRLGYLPQAEVDRALGDATVAVFPYRPELDQSGALLRALGAGVPAVAYDVGGVAEPVRASAPGASCRPATSTALAAAVARAALRPGGARGGARRRTARARGADVGRRRARASRAVRGDHVIFRRGRFADVIARQLDVFAEDEARRPARGGARGEAPLRPRRPRRGRGAYGDYVDVVEAATEALADMR